MHRLSWRDLECGIPERLEKFVNGGSEILDWGGLLAQDRTQNVPRFSLHGAGALSGISGKAEGRSPERPRQAEIVTRCAVGRLPGLGGANAVRIIPIFPAPEVGESLA